MGLLLPNIASPDSGGDQEAEQPPIATVYQNSEQIAGILQQLFHTPLLVDESRERADESSEHGEAGLNADFDIKAKANAIPALLGLQGGVSSRARVEGSLSGTSSSVSKQQFAYTRAYNLHLVLEELRKRGLISDFETTEPVVGEFVTYQAPFDPAELTLLLDVASPELVGAIAKFAAERSYASSFPASASFEAVQVHATKMQLEGESRRALATEVARAFRADARQLTTREYYARVSGSKTAVTICDLEHFVVDDPDRLLDGTFTVFGKVISERHVDMPTFARNKILRNVAPEAFDLLIGQLQTQLAKVPLNGESASGLLDTKLTSRILGESWRILPLAIFV